MRLRRAGILVAAAGLALTAGGVTPSTAAAPNTRFGLNMQHATAMAIANAMIRDARQLAQQFMSRIRPDSNFAWTQEYLVDSCAGGGVSCFSSGQLVAPRHVALVEEEGLTLGSSGLPDFVLVGCESFTPNAGGYHLTAAGAIGGDLVSPGFTSAGTGGVANASPSSTAAVGYDTAARTTGYNLYSYEGDPGAPTTPGFTLTNGVNFTNNPAGTIIGGHMVATAGPVILQQDGTWNGSGYNLGPLTFSTGSMSCDASGNSGSFERIGYNVLE